MLEFSPITYKNIQRVRLCYRRCRYGLSDYSLGFKLMWKSYFHSEAAFACGCMIVKNTYGGKVRFDFPVPETDEGNVEGALCEMEKYCMEQYIPLIFCAVPREMLGGLVTRYRFCRTESHFPLDEYVYVAENMMSFAGKHYSGQRNHINKFYKTYPEAIFRPIQKDDTPKIKAFFEEFGKSFTKTAGDAEAELRHSKMMMCRDFSWGCGGCIEYNGKIIALSLGEICGDTMIIHIEKALYEYEGVYPAIVEAFAARFCGGVRYINREEDAGDPGLRRSKTQYRPKLMLSKYDVYVDTELCAWDKIPVIHTERLILSQINMGDAEKYNALCLDDEHNKYWGYDYREDCENPGYDYFVMTAEKDFENKVAVNFAIRYEKKFAGEVILYDFDHHGGAQIGVRVLKKFGGRGIGKEAIAAVMEKGLYDLGLSVIYAKCYNENIKSYRMLSAVMQKTGEDETFKYFEKRI